jgi:hypothetical protein
MWQAILMALLKQAENNPSAVLNILQQVLDLLKANPDLLASLAKEATTTPPVAH